jgi:hypothetical protein
MTTQDLELGVLFDHSPARHVQTSAAAEVAFLCALVALMASPFSLMMAVCVGLAAVGVVLGILGMARASRPDAAGGLLAALGLVLSLATLAVVGLRYAGIDTAFGDGLLPSLADGLRTLNDLLPRP